MSRVQKISIEINDDKKEYNIIIGENIRANINKYINEVYQGDKLLIVSDENIMNLYGAEIIDQLKSEYTISKHIIKPGEQSKNFTNFQKGHDILINDDFKRDNMVIALGGGVVGDLAGFIAATYMRGIAYIQIPTTLLAQVDSSVGGKTAINHSKGKNIIGNFKQPEIVLIDPGFLKTLARRELITGMAEVIKYSFISDKDFVDYLYNNKDKIYNLDMDAMEYIIYKSCNIKAGIVRKDEKEEGVRAFLNFGHTIGHALEAVTKYDKYNHGEAVGIGMVGAARLSYKLKYIDKKIVGIMESLIKLYDLPLSFQYKENCNNVFKALFHDKKALKNKLRWILLKEVGKPVIKSNIDYKKIKQVLEGLS
ncbi:MAG: 3-dehydroquinate synthase [Halothermotrichaceae bacterium]